MAEVVAKALAALSHANIAQIYGFENVAGIILGTAA